MNKLKWFFMSRYKKLLYQIECAKANKQVLHLSNGVVLDFSEPEQINAYRVELKNPSDDDPYYMVDAPNEYIAKWCGANLYNNEFIAFKSYKDMDAKILKLEEEM